MLFWRFGCFFGYSLFRNTKESGNFHNQRRSSVGKLGSANDVVLVIVRVNDELIFNSSILDASPLTNTF